MFRASTVNSTGGDNQPCLPQRLSLFLRPVSPAPMMCKSDRGESYPAVVYPRKILLWPGGLGVCKRYALGLHRQISS